MPKKKTEKTAPEKEPDTKSENVADADGESEQPKDENAEKLKALEAELDAQKDKFLRLAAEYDNYRKRTANEKLGIYDDATAKAVAEILPVADSVAIALASLKDADPEILKGVELISNQLAKTFEKLKIEAYGKQGDRFDPNLHNAISKIDDESLDENTLAQVFQTGYKIGDKIIRHAMVQVANCD